MLADALRRIGGSDKAPLLVVGSNTTGKIASSPDGVAWTLRHDPGGGDINSVAWSPKLKMYAAVGVSSDFATGVVRTSPDGITWTARTANAGGHRLRSVVWAGDRFIAVGGTKTIYSTNGIAWTAAADLSTGGLNAVSWSPTLNLAVRGGLDGSGNVLWSSPDGITWTARTSPDGWEVHGAEWLPGHNIFVVISISSSNIVHSSNGTGWSSVSGPATGVRASSVAGSNGSLVVKNSGSHARRATNPTGGSGGWTSAGVPGDSHAVAHNKPRGLWLISDASSGLRTSPDGSAWTARTLPGSFGGALGLMRNED